MSRVWWRAAVTGAAGTLAAAAALAGAGPAAAKPAPPALAFTPAPYHYGQVAAGHAASHAFTLTNTGGRATGRVSVRLAGAAACTVPTTRTARSAR